MRARRFVGVVVASIAVPAAMSSCFVPEATIEPTGSMGSMMTSGVSSGTGGDPNAFSPHVDGPVSYGETMGGEKEIAPTGNPMQRHLVWIPAPQGSPIAPGRWYAFYLEQGKLAATRYANNQWLEAGSVVLEAGYKFEDGRVFGADVDPTDSTLVHFAVDWKNGAVHVQGRAPDDGTSPFVFSFTNSGMWAEFPGGALGAPPMSDLSELFLVCGADNLYAFTLDATGALLGTEYVVADAKWKNWTKLVDAPLTGKRCFLSGFDRRTDGEIGLVFSESESCTMPGPNMYYAVFLRIG